MEKKARIEYRLSEAGRKKSLLVGGSGMELQVLETNATPEIIKLARVKPDGTIILYIGFTPSCYPNYPPNRVRVSVKVKESSSSPGYMLDEEIQVVYFDDIQTPESLVIWEQSRIKCLAEAEELAKPEIERLQKEYDIKKAKEEEEQVKRQEEYRRRDEENAEIKATLEKEKKEWIAAYGSDHLKRATALDYNCQKKYVLERATKEFPNFVVDYNNKAGWKERVCPSKEALSAVEILIEQREAKVVWLTFPAYELEEYEEFEPCEAVVISNYLGLYTLVCEM